MPPDVLLMLASSGITFIASLMFFVSPDGPPKEVPGPEVTFCAPPERGVPPPLPVNGSANCLQTPGGKISIHHIDGAWVFVTEPQADSLAVTLNGNQRVSDVRWHGRAGLQRVSRKPWAQKPGRA